jgi:rSAM/selenodomain-associated transferase 1
MSAGLVLVLAKAPVPGRVKTRLCPPCTPEQAAAVAAAALADTLDAVTACRSAGRTLVVDGRYPAPPGWGALAQRGDGLGERLAHAFAATARPGTPVLLVGMDTPQLTAGLLDDALERLTGPDGPDAVLGLAEDGGWWTLGLRDARHAAILPGIRTSTATTGPETRDALHRRGLTVGALPRLRDVDTAADAHEVAALCRPDSRFARAVATLVPRPSEVAR